VLLTDAWQCCSASPFAARGHPPTSAARSVPSEVKVAQRRGLEFGRKPKLTLERIAQLSSVEGTVGCTLPPCQPHLDHRISWNRSWQHVTTCAGGSNCFAMTRSKDSCCFRLNSARPSEP
jgi:hypothetical protein